MKGVSGTSASEGIFRNYIIEDELNYLIVNARMKLLNLFTRFTCIFGDLTMKGKMYL